MNDSTVGTDGRAVSEHAYRDSEERFRLMVEGVQDHAIFMLDPTGMVQSWNIGAQRIKQYSAEEVIGKHFSLFYPPEDRSSKPAEDLHAAARDGSFQEEAWRVRKDGSRLWASVIINPLKDREGKLIGYSEVTRDLTERRAADEAYRESEQRFRLMIESVQDSAIFLLDEHGKVKTWNAGAERIQGYSADEIVGKHFSIFYAPEDRSEERAARELERALGTGKFEEEGWRVRKDGRRMWANVTITPLKNRSGKVVGYSKVTRDLTERRAAEEAVRRSQARFEGIVRISEDAIISIDDTQMITMFNDGAEKIFGYPANEVVGKKIDVLIPERFAAVHHRYVANFGGSPDALRAMNERGAIYGRRKDGAEFPAEASISKFEVGGEKVLTVRLRDITERRNAEEAVRRSQARFEGIVRISEDAIISIDEDQKITMFNDGAEKIFGYTLAEVLSKKIDMLIPARFGSLHHGYVSNFSVSPDTLRPMNDRGSLFGLRKDGSEFPAEASISKFEIESEKVLTVRLRDITERKRAEEQIRSSLQEKEILLKEFIIG